VSNPHFTQTITALELASEMLPGSQGVALAAIQAQATLALAYEMRTQNLIASLQPIKGMDDDSTYGWMPEVISARLTEIGRRLQLPKGGVPE
jgi:hypothetical protein